MDLAEAETQLKRTTNALCEILGQSLLAVWLHGSAVTGKLRPQSDLDLMLIVAQELTDSQRDAILSTLLQLSSRHPTAPGGPRCLEVIAFRRADLARDGTQERAEFLYGEWLRAEFEAGRRLAPVYKPDNILMLAQARQHSTALYGPPAPELVPEIPQARVLRAMQNALPELLHGLMGGERNVLLTLARMWHTTRTGDFVPKDEAAVWALRQIETDDANLLDLARRGYLGEAADDWRGQSEVAQRLATRLAQNII